MAQGQEILADVVEQTARILNIFPLIFMLHTTFPYHGAGQYFHIIPLCTLPPPYKTKLCQIYT